MASIQKRENGKWRARYRDGAGKEHARHFDRKVDAQRWLDETTAAVLTGTYVDPSLRRTTVAAWCDMWLDAYVHRPSTMRQARVHVRRIVARFGSMELSAVRPSDVKAWMSELAAEGIADSTRYALHARLKHVLEDAVHDGRLPRSPISRRTAPPVAKQRTYVATTEQVWALHDAMPEGMRPGILLGAFAGLRVGEIVAIRTTDVDFMRGIISPAIQYPGETPLKTDESRTAIPIPAELSLELARVPQLYASPTLVVGVFGRSIAPYTFESAFRSARQSVAGLPEGFRVHDLRHYFASLLIASGLDVKTVQKRMRHASAKTTLDTYSHMWPDRDETTRAAVAQVFTSRAATA